MLAGNVTARQMGSAGRSEATAAFDFIEELVRGILGDDQRQARDRAARAVRSLAVDRLR
jgi:hypothetical protein